MKNEKDKTEMTKGKRRKCKKGKKERKKAKWKIGKSKNNIENGKEKERVTK